MFASISQLRKEEMTFKDDLESLGYVIAMMVKGSLPWQLFAGRVQDQEDYFIKQRHPSVLCQGLPDELCRYITKVQGLKASDPINYSHLKSLLLKWYRSEVYHANYKYDWVEVFLRQNNAYLRALTVHRGGKSNNDDDEEGPKRMRGSRSEMLNANLPSSEALEPLVDNKRLDDATRKKLNR